MVVVLLLLLVGVLLVLQTDCTWELRRRFDGAGVAEDAANLETGCS